MILFNVGLLVTGHLKIENTHTSIQENDIQNVV